MAQVFQKGQSAGVLQEEPDGCYLFTYDPDYQGLAVSWTMPVKQRVYRFATFPPFFEGLLPEGYQLEALLRQAKLDRNDLFGQLLKVGGDMVGSVTVFPITP